MEKYTNRQEAGQVLAKALQHYAQQKNLLVLALPRGGVPVAFEIAQALHAPLDVFIVRKLGVPGHEELAMGALATGGTTVLNKYIIHEFAISTAALQAVTAKEQKELTRREQAYRDDKPFPKLQDKTVILVDDGIATGATMQAAIKALRALKAAKIVVAVPVAEANLAEKISTLADEFICPLKPTIFYAVGAWYDDFSQTSDEEVYDLLKTFKK